MIRTGLVRRLTPLQRIATLIAPIALVVVAVYGSPTHGFVGGLVLGVCIALAVTSGVVLALGAPRSAYVRTVPVDDADMAILDALEPLHVDRPEVPR